VLQGLVNDHLDGKLSQEEVIANAWVLLLGGFDTVAQALAFTMYLLAKHPEAQEKVLMEVRANIQVRDLFYRKF
jgi:cytochrome P450